MRSDVTRALADWIVRVEGSSIPGPALHEGLRTILNWFGCTIGGASHETVQIAHRTIAPFQGRATSTVLGLGRRADAPSAAFLNGISAHVLDYDDTHLKALTHPGAPVVSAVFALAELKDASGRDFVEASIIGLEVACRIANSVLPDHYERGWHLTGTAGIFGAAAGCARLLRLDAQKTTWALGIAATQSAGLREMFGTMCKSFHPGRAAQNGLWSALLAEQGFDSSERAIEAPRGFAQVTSATRNYSEILGELGSRWESASNTYKPFACGIVIHPAIEACLEFREELGEGIRNIEAIAISAHPLVLELTGIEEPTTGLEGKFSVVHAAACALIRGDASPSAFTDEAVNDPQLVAMRRRIRVASDPDCHEAAVSMTIALADGRQIRKEVARAVGSKERPLTDTQLEHKIMNLIGPVLGTSASRHAIQLLWRLPNLSAASEVASSLRQAA